jgi:hypothetical protein
MKHPSASTLRLSDWRAFAAAAGATLAAVSAADASIIYGTLNDAVQLPGAAPYSKATTVKKSFLVDGIQMTVAVKNQFSFGNHERGAYIAGNVGFLVSATVAVLKFSKGQPIVGGTERLTYGNRGLLDVVTNNNNSFHNFPLNKTAFAGFQLPESKGGGYGWLQLDVLDRDNNGSPDGIDVLGYAYSDAGGGIDGGQGIPSDVPEPGTKALALLALGSAGVLAWRRRRSATPAGR